MWEKFCFYEEPFYEKIGSNFLELYSKDMDSKNILMIGIIKVVANQKVAIDCLIKILNKTFLAGSSAAGVTQNFKL